MPFVYSKLLVGLVLLFLSIKGRPKCSSTVPYVFLLCKDGNQSSHPNQEKGSFTLLVLGFSEQIGTIMQGTKVIGVSSSFFSPLIGIDSDFITSLPGPWKWLP
jgi:hypothetical protein